MRLVFDERMQGRTLDGFVNRQLYFQVSAGRVYTGLSFAS